MSLHSSYALKTHRGFWYTEAVAPKLFNNGVTWPTILAGLQDVCIILMISFVVASRYPADPFIAFGALFLIPVLGCLAALNFFAAIYYLWRKRSGRPRWETWFIIISFIITILIPIGFS